MTIVLLQSVKISDGLEARKTSNGYKIEGLCFDVEVVEHCLTVHKSFVSTSLNIIHIVGCTFHLSYPYRQFQLLVYACRG
jgi:hypothetical protein